MQKTQEVEAQSSEYFKSIKNKESEKEKLLHEYDSEQTREKNLDFKTLLSVYLFAGLILVIVLPKIYITNQIYYTSKDINKKYHEYLSLKEEREHLKSQLESMKFQHQVIDDL